MIVWSLCDASSCTPSMTHATGEQFCFNSCMCLLLYGRPCIFFPLVSPLVECLPPPSPFTEAHVRDSPVLPTPPRARSFFLGRGDRRASIIAD